MSAKNYDGDGYRIEYPFFTAERVEQTDNGKGYWPSIVVAVFQHDSDDLKKEIGRYNRNYHTNSRNFSWTRKGDRYFALYSPKYTCIRVMEIFPDKGFEDIGGEEASASGFCPTDIYIPTLREYFDEEFYGGSTGKVKDWSRILDYYPSGSRVTEISKNTGRQRLHYPDGKDVRAYTGKPDKYNPTQEAYDNVWGPQREFVSGFIILPPKLGFVAGCQWGDDSSWKIQYLDVSRIDEGIITRDERFGYIEMPAHLTLEKAIDIRDFDEDNGRLTIAINLEFDYTTGDPWIWSNSLYNKILSGHKKVEEYDEKISSVNFNGSEAELQARWKEQGERIRKEIEETGGKIGLSK